MAVSVFRSTTPVACDGSDQASSGEGKAALEPIGYVPPGEYETLFYESTRVA